MIHSAASQAPTPIAPPTGLYRVLVWTGGRVEEIEERPETEEGREACNKIFRGSQLPAALCRGATVVKRNAKGEARAVAFKTFAAGDVAAPPALRPTAPAVRPAAPTQPAAPEPVTPRPVEPAAAPVVPTTTAEEHAPVKKRVDTVPVCSKCGQEPRARTTSRTHPGTETYGEKCRKAALDRDRHAAMRDAKRAAKAAGAAPQKPAKKAPPPVAAPAASLADGLARVQRHAAAIARLGGIDAAEQLAALVADAGGVAEVAAALTTLRSLA